ncbi:hypothetical protein HZA56_07165 [Candidatus Poribacteria bacterium]|nr:hypothetical protein [Candidatus Poribacteria bacterium]
MTAKWEHPGGKLREAGASALTDAEILSILIAPGSKGRPALKIAEDVLQKFGSLEGLCDQPLERLYEIKGLADAKIIRLAAAYELAVRLTREKGKSAQ